MPYSGPNDPKLPENVKDKPVKQRRRWVSVFNSAWDRCQKEGGKNCEGVAFRQANGVAFKESDMSSVVIDGLAITTKDLAAIFKRIF